MNINEIIIMTQTILQGLGVTLAVYVLTLIFGGIIGLVLAICRISVKNKIVLKSIDLYTYILRGTPLMLQLAFVYFGLRGISFQFGEYLVRPFGFLNAFWAGTITFILNYSAYFTEIFRGGLQSIDKGQEEAIRALGLTHVQSMRYVIVPQSLRAVMPALTNEAVTLIKDTALLGTITIDELLRNANALVMSQGTMLPFVIVGGIYLLLASLIIKVFKGLEQKYINCV